MKENFEIKRHEAEWKKRRFLAKIENERAVAAINQDLDDRIKKITDEVDEQIRRWRNEASERILSEKLKMYDRLAEIAEEQDAFEDKFRNYIDTIPKVEDE